MKCILLHGEMAKRFLAIFVSIVLLLCHVAYSVFVRNNTSSENTGPPDGVKLCVDLNMEETVCSSNPMEVYKRLYSKRTLEDIHQGVPQRIDGSEEEKKSVVEVLKLMNVYWYEEVLSNIEYEEVRTSWFVIGAVLLFALSL